MLEIVALDIRLDHQVFTDLMNDVISDENSRTGISFEWSEKTASLSQSGINMYKITYTNLDSSNTIDLVAEQSGADIVFKPFELRNYNSSFYKCNYQDDDLTQVMLLSLKRCALKNKGTFGCVFDGNYTLVTDGRDVSTKVKSVALIDDKNKIYSLKSQQIEDIGDEEDTVCYVPKYIISEWLEENPAFQMKLQNVPKNDQFELMAQFAIYQKQKGMINANQFRDIIIQVGSFAEMIGGFKEKDIKNLYQFFV